MTKSPGLYREIALEIAGADLSQDGYLNLRIQGRSMVPFLCPGDFIRVQPVEAVQLKPGMILSFQRERGLITHRLVRVQGDHLYLKGDARHHLDPMIVIQDVVGQAVEIQRGGRWMALPQTGWSRSSALVAGFSAFEGDVFRAFGGQDPVGQARRERFLRGMTLPLRGMIYLGLLILERQLK